MTDFGDLNLKIPLILAISVFMRRNSFSCSAELRMKKKFYNLRAKGQVKLTLVFSAIKTELS